MCFTSPGLKTCALSRRRSVVSVPLQLVIAQLARGRVRTDSTPGAAAFRTGPHKHTGPGLKLSTMPDVHTCRNRAPWPRVPGRPAPRGSFRSRRTRGGGHTSGPSRILARFRGPARGARRAGNLYGRAAVQICSSANSVKSSGIKNCVSATHAFSTDISPCLLACRCAERSFSPFSIPAYRYFFLLSSHRFMRARAISPLMPNRYLLEVAM